MEANGWTHISTRPAASRAKRMRTITARGQPGAAPTSATDGTSHARQGGRTDPPLAGARSARQQQQSCTGWVSAGQNATNQPPPVQRSSPRPARSPSVETTTTTPTDIKAIISKAVQIAAQAFTAGQTNLEDVTNQVLSKDVADLLPSPVKDDHYWVRRQAHALGRVKTWQKKVEWERQRAATALKRVQWAANHVDYWQRQQLAAERREIDQEPVAPVKWDESAGESSSVNGDEDSLMEAAESTSWWAQQAHHKLVQSAAPDHKHATANAGHFCPAPAETAQNNEGTGINLSNQLDVLAITTLLSEKGLTEQDVLVRRAQLQGAPMVAPGVSPQEY